MASKPRKSLTKDQWEYIHSQEKVCVICKKKGLSPKLDKHRVLNIDHIVPVIDGGLNDKNNLRWLCILHNNNKTNRNSVAITKYEMICFDIVRSA